MEEKEIENIAVKAMKKFPYKIKNPIILFMDKKEFSRYLNGMKLKKHLSKTPCFVVEMKGGDVIYYCEEIINALVKGLRKETRVKFIEGITLHELFHIYNQIPVASRNSALFSEELVHEELDEKFPEQSKILKRFKKK